MRKRMTERQGRRSEGITARSVLAEIEELEKRLAGEDEQLMQDAEAIADEEVAIAEESTGVVVDEALSSENEKANDNWPVADREAVASSLVRMAEMLLEEK